jgi:hypothetical protein
MIFVYLIASALILAPAKIPKGKKICILTTRIINNSSGDAIQTTAACDGEPSSELELAQTPVERFDIEAQRQMSGFGKLFLEEGYRMESCDYLQQPPTGLRFYTKYHCIFTR